MYIKVVELEEPYLIVEGHFKIYLVSFEQNWKYNFHNKKCIKMYGKYIGTYVKLNFAYLCHQRM